MADCLECRGACCESFILPVADVRPPSADARRWLELHAERRTSWWGEELAFECRCTALTPEGRCGIYASRPRVCRTYLPGGADCLQTLRERRTAAQYARIRGPHDPASIHGDEAA